MENRNTNMWRTGGGHGHSLIKWLSVIAKKSAIGERNNVLFSPMAHSVALTAFSTLISTMSLQAEVKLGLPFSDHMVLQRDMPVPIWGEANPGERVAVEFDGQTKSVTTPASGKWMVKLDPLKMDVEPHVLTVKGENTILIKDVLVGEVWLCSGQSNMEATMLRLESSEASSPEEKAAVVARLKRELAATTAGIRLFRVVNSRTDVSTTKNVWTKCNPEALIKFSALAYFFAKELREGLKVPIGVIDSSVGGTRIEAWTPPEAYANVPAFKAETAVSPLSIDGMEPGGKFKSMIQPLVPFAIRGIIWYQGESNLLEVRDGLGYADKMEALVQSWRALWGEGDIPFYYVQLPRYAYSKRRSAPLTMTTPESLAWLREGQKMALTIPDTGMVITIDLVDVPNYLHPSDKWDIGYRLALLAFAKTYHQDGVIYSGPVYRAMEMKDGKIYLDFDFVGKGLVSKDGKPLTDFIIAGADQIFEPAQAVIEGNQVVVSSPKVLDPQAVRFAWNEQAMPNLFNRDGLPAGPFRTDDWPEPKRPKDVWNVLKTSTRAK